MVNKLKLIFIFAFAFALFMVNAPAVFSSNNNQPAPTFQIEMLSWGEVKKFITKGANFQIIDIDTGLSFNVQMRAGSRHADVQPLTSADTKILKSIYNGKWSWNRRAIIVIVDNKFIAASMNGMPHGAGAIKNSFPGHFCIHFYDSRTHKTNEIDLAHQLMVYKAAGKLDKYLGSINANEIIESFVVAINEQNYELMGLLIEDDENVEFLKQNYKDIASIKLKSSVPIDKNNLFFYKTIVEVSTYKIGQRNVNSELILTLKRKSIMSAWKIDIANSIINL